jgi:hypothetical protein
LNRLRPARHGICHLDKGWPPVHAFPMSRTVKIQWLDQPEEHDYPAAQSYLSLIYEDKQVRQWIAALRRAAATEFKAKDIFRASGLSLLGIGNFHVEKDRDKIRGGKKLSPILLARQAGLGKVVIADGYHRLCAVYSFDEDALIPCRIV